MRFPNCTSWHRCCTLIEIQKIKLQNILSSLSLLYRLSLSSWCVLICCVYHLRLFWLAWVLQAHFMCMPTSPSPQSHLCKTNRPRPSSHIPSLRQHLTNSCLCHRTFTQQAFHLNLLHREPTAKTGSTRQPNQVTRTSAHPSSCPSSSRCKLHHKASHVIALLECPKNRTNEENGHTLMELDDEPTAATNQVPTSPSSAWHPVKQRSWNFRNEWDDYGSCISAIWRLKNRSGKV